MTLPGWAYADPARIVEANEIRLKGCAVCERAVFIGDRAMCGAGLSLPACKRDKKNGFKLAAECGG
ncbi:hypothetical protein [Azotobacter beijerinckii]|uniref:Uncharacterized protein n=1 Tax=Azotobacter beijerinckii TaxID=170623 RepID=A0A1I4GA29_9GAMM|nr:hypothetical protein [Azotobacter beijerinckii]SFB46288.1 hypothetical protein SAMN04244571_02992 [Azotobacter beijerinckii]SFL26729.1 hypothetical protein SAMN04244574_03738 [Azotobacter beijerinckii]